MSCNWPWLRNKQCSTENAFCQQAHEGGLSLGLLSSFGKTVFVCFFLLSILACSTSPLELKHESMGPEQDNQHVPFQSQLSPMVCLEKPYSLQPPRTPGQINLYNRHLWAATTSADMLRRVWIPAEAITLAETKVLCLTKTYTKYYETESFNGRCPY